MARQTLYLHAKIKYLKLHADPERCELHAEVLLVKVHDQHRLQLEHINEVQMLCSLGPSLWF